MCGPDCPGAQHDSISRQPDGAVGTDAIGGHGPSTLDRNTATRAYRPRASGWGGRAPAAGRRPLGRSACRRRCSAVRRRRLPATACPGIAPLRSATHGYPISVAASTKEAVQPSNSDTRRTSIGPSDPCSGPTKSRSFSIARKCGSTSVHDQPGSDHLSKSSGRRPAEIAAVDRPGPAHHRARA